VIVISGNHDNAKRFAAVESVFRAAGVRVVPDVRRPADGGVIEITARNGARAQVACLPWVAERMLYTAADLMREQEEPYKEYAEELPRLIAALCAGLDPAAVTVLAGHLFVSGAAVGDGERDLTIGQIFAVTPAALPTTVQYIALGHVHRPQDVPGAATPARYAGSLLQLDFGEATQPKSVTLVDAKPGRPPRITQRALTAGRRLIQIRGTMDDLDAYRDTEDEAWLKVELVCDGPQPGLADAVREILPNALEVRLDYPREDPEKRAGELRRLSPRELFSRYYRERHGAPLDDAVVKLFDELLEEVGGAPA
jgi:exonuclease SbcD